MNHLATWRWLFPNEPPHLLEYMRMVSRQTRAGGVVLDLGCGNNAMFAHLRSAKRVFWGADFQAHPHLVDAAWFRQLPPDGRLPFADASFDFVVSAFVLEHVQDPARFLGEIQRVLKPGGRFLAHSINGDHYVPWLRSALDVLPHSVMQWLVKRLYGRAEHDTFPTCYRLNSRRQLTRAAKAAGLKVLDLRRYACAAYFAFNRWTYVLASMTDWLLERVLPGTGRLYFTVTMQRPSERESALHSAQAA